MRVRSGVQAPYVGFPFLPRVCKRLMVPNVAAGSPALPKSHSEKRHEDIRQLINSVN